jgi:uracil-DNA glycosylase
MKIEYNINKLIRMAKQLQKIDSELFDEKTTEVLRVDISKLTARLSDEWLKILNSTNVQKYLIEVCEKLQFIPNDQLCPQIDHVFESLRWIQPYQIRAVILGQDPYTRLSDAHGLAFSSLSNTTPTSLRNIFNALHKQGFLAEKKQATNCLISWETQGILLFNSYLTTLVDKSFAHKALWNNFTCAFIRELCDYAKKINVRLIFALWGEASKSFGTIIQKPAPNKEINDDPTEHLITQYCHPVARNISFDDCPSFKEITNHIKETSGYTINWTPSHDTWLECFTDGSAVQKSDRSQNTSGWGVYIIQGNNSYAYIGRDDHAPPHYTTSQCAEGMAILAAILYCLNLDPRERSGIKIYTDSKFWFDMIYKYMPAWKDDDFDSHANPHITQPLWYYYNLLKQSSNVMLEHINSHTKEWKKDRNSYKYKIGQSNENADKLANHARLNLTPGNCILQKLN